MHSVRLVLRLRLRQLSDQSRRQVTTSDAWQARSTPLTTFDRLVAVTCAHPTNTSEGPCSSDQWRVTRSGQTHPSFAACALTQEHRRRVSDVSGRSVWLRQFSSTPTNEHRHLSKPKQQTLHEAGWTRQAVYNIPNALSMARLVSGPAIAWLILNEQWGLALGSLVISGASDWADGYVAKRYGQSSVLGSYLDPLADKVLIGCVVGALGYQGSLPWQLVTIIIGRDVVLLSGAFVHRFKMVGWQWPGAAEFFRVTVSSKPAAQAQDPSHSQTGTSMHHLVNNAADSNSSNSRGEGPEDKTTDQSKGEASYASVEDSISSISSLASLDHGQRKQPDEASRQDSAKNTTTGTTGNAPPAVFVQPLYISKVNTCFQLLLVGGCLTSSWYAWPPQEALFVLGVATGGTTLASCGAYVRAFLKGTIK